MQMAGLDLVEGGRLLNGGVFGHHARSSTFSTHLSGRFYKNSTLAAHAARKKRAARMRAKKRELEQAILLEERRAELLEERLRERKEQCLRLQRRRQEAALDIQCWMRQRIAAQKVDSIRHLQRAENKIALFCQARYRGSKRREIARTRRLEVAQREREYNAAQRIQCVVRTRAARRIVETKRNELRRRRYAGACTIQASVRGQQCRRRYLEMLEEKQRRLHLLQLEACTRIQSIHRRNVARKEADRLRAAKHRAAEEEKPPKPNKRIPLHMRRYSTYSVGQVASIAVNSDGGSGGATKSRRRSSVIGLSMPSASRIRSRRSSCPTLEPLKTPLSQPAPSSSQDPTKCNESTANSSANHNASASVSSSLSSSVEAGGRPAPTEPAGQGKLARARQRAAARVAQRNRNRPKNQREEAMRSKKAKLQALEDARKQRLRSQKKGAKNRSKKSSKPEEIIIERGGGDGNCTVDTRAEGDGNCSNDEAERAPPQTITTEPVSIPSDPLPETDMVKDAAAPCSTSAPKLEPSHSPPTNNTKRKPPIQYMLPAVLGKDSFDDPFDEQEDDLG